MWRIHSDRRGRENYFIFPTCPIGLCTPVQNCMFHCEIRRLVLRFKLCERCAALEHSYLVSSLVKFGYVGIEFEGFAVGAGGVGVGVGVGVRNSSSSGGGGGSSSYVHFSRAIGGRAGTPRRIDAHVVACRGLGRGAAWRELRRPEQMSSARAMSGWESKFFRACETCTNSSWDGAGWWSKKPCPARILKQSCAEPHLQRGAAAFATGGQAKQNQVLWKMLSQCCCARHIGE